MSLSEVLTIIIHFHQSNHKTFKHYYTDCVRVSLVGADFPHLVSYNRFVELMSEDHTIGRIASGVVGAANNRQLY